MESKADDISVSAFFEVLAFITFSLKYKRI